MAVLNDEPQATDLLLVLMGILAGGFGALGRPAEADAMFSRVAVLAEQRGSAARQAHLAVYAGTWAFYRGRWNEALHELHALAEYGQWVSHDISIQLRPDNLNRPFIAGIGGLVAAHRDDRAAADTYLNDTAQMDLGKHFNEYAGVARSVVAERQGAPRDALDTLLGVFDPDGSREFTGYGVLTLVWMPDVVRLALAVDDQAVAAAAASMAVREATRETRPTSVAVAQHCQGLVEGDPVAVRGAAEQLDLIGYPMFTGQALENAAVLYAQQGDARSARIALAEAVEIYTQLDASWDILRAYGRLRAHNVRPATRVRRRPATGWEALTPTEQKVAHMVAKGRSNPDIASDLFLSRHTVESHVSHILAKLDAKSRVEIARVVALRSAAADGPARPEVSPPG